jgi:hypothetical protein
MLRARFRGTSIRAKIRERDDKRRAGAQIFVMSGWSILAGELRIPWGSTFAAHRMIIVANPAGEAVRQINGLASWFDRTNQRWRHKPIGYLLSDRLRGYDTREHPRTFLPIHGVGLMSRLVAPAIESGATPVLADKLSDSDVAAILAPGLEALKRINALSEGPEGGAGLPYPFMGFGPNSNSFFSTLLTAMDFVEPSFARPAHVVPGAGALLLSPDVIGEIRKGQGRSSTSGTRKSATAAAIASTPSAVG